MSSISLSDWRCTTWRCGHTFAQGPHRNNNNISHNAVEVLFAQVLDRSPIRTPNELMVGRSSTEDGHEATAAVLGRAEARRLQYVILILSLNIEGLV